MSADTQRLRHRLSRLKREPAETGDKHDQLDELRARIQRISTRSRSRPDAAPPSTKGLDASLDDAQTAERLGGWVEAPGLVGIERPYDLAECHGRQPLGRARDLPRALPGEATNSLPTESLVFLDTETTGLAGGTGTIVFLLGMARLEGDTLVVRQYLLTRVAAEPALLQAASTWLAGTEGLVTFNGKRFDLPLLTTRCRLARADDPFAERDHLDLLYPLRRAFGRYWDNCRLVTAERNLLRFEREDDLPGEQAPEAWQAFLRRGDLRLLPGVIQHNRWDLVSLVALLPALSQAHAEPGAWEADILAVARACQQHDIAHAYALLQYHETMLDEQGRRELAWLHRRFGQWDSARRLWLRLANQGCPEALENLAKYYEHVARDCSAALQYARQLPAGSARERRLNRLWRKRGQEDWARASRARR